MKTTMRCVALLSLLFTIATGGALAGIPDELSPQPLPAGTDILGIGSGLFEQPGNEQLFVPEGATVVQVLLYWNGFHSEEGNGDDEITLNDVPFTGTLIGGPRLFFTDTVGDHWSSTYRADITDAALIGPGNNVLAFAGGDFDRITNGASVLVVIDDGSAPENLQLRDGQDLAFRDFAPPLDTTVEQTFDFLLSTFPRKADITLIASSVEGPASGDALARPNLVRVTVDGQAPYDVIDPFNSNSGFEWDHTAISVDVPAGATFITIQALSEDGEIDELPASFAWLASALELSEPFCGDSNLDPDESCDPPGDPAGASGNACREDCTVCGDMILDAGEQCDDGNNNNDDDCRNDCTMPVCGDGIVDMQNGETCDPEGSQAGGNGNLCREDCTVCGDEILDPGEDCDDGNGIDDDGCRNDCTVPECGDGIIDPDETCDPPGEEGGGNGNLCREDCTVCGDAIVDAGEDCDDGNGIDDDDCRNDCTVPECGDGIIDDQNGETCDPPGEEGGGNGNLCREDCTSCGDAIVDAGEDCDDGNGIDDDGCRNDCTVPECGDGSIDDQNGETCDPPGEEGGGNGNLCREDCTSCGDAIVDADEDCDDGNGIDDDGCRNDCTVPECGDGIIDDQNGETCDPPGEEGGGNGNLCREDCTSCGDMIVDPDEECDDGNGINDDGCRNDCTIPECGDGIVDPGETCDPPGGDAGGNGNQCREDCTVCGDMIVDPDEDCDDGNGIDDDGCRNDCTIPECGDGIIDPDETCDPPGETGGGNGNLCREDCTVCGDTIVDPDEECDDGNGIDEDDCRNDCTVPFCGDSVIDPQNDETCDPPGLPGGVNDNECREDCTVCGDGIVDAGEECDDGNDNDFDNCTNDCREPMLVDLESFTVELTDDGVVLRWVTASEKDNVGFQLYRVAPVTGAREKAVEIALHTGVISAKGDELTGAEYQFLDNATLEPGTYSYILADIDLFGTVTRHAPIEIVVPERTRQAPTAGGRQAD